MGRDPCAEYVIRGQVQAMGPERHVVTIRATRGDQVEPGHSLIETYTARSPEEARRKQWEMIRELSARLTAGGNRVVDVQADF